ncbi:MAG: hypothetical protein QOH61_1811, partial [Chloroflexota bacterium]|nr:hypothetical protein [Chloroflexota bacterium]
MSCSSCRNFRPAVAARLGYCALDRTHEPLHGDEIRPCWQALTDVEPGPEPGIFQLVRPRSGLGPGALRSVD